MFHCLAQIPNIFLVLSFVLIGFAQGAGGSFSRLEAALGQIAFQRICPRLFRTAGQFGCEQLAANCSGIPPVAFYS